MRIDSQVSAEAAYKERQDAADIVKVGVRVPKTKRQTIIEAARKMREDDG
jgi:hypothetical protein